MQPTPFPALAHRIAEQNRGETSDPNILDDRESTRRGVVLEELLDIDVRHLWSAPQSGGRIDVVGPDGKACDLRDAILLHGRLLFPSRAQGKSMFARLGVHLARCNGTGVEHFFPLLVRVDGMETDRLDEAELARQSPPLGLAGVRRMLEDGRAVVLVDNVDEAESPGELAESIAELGSKYPESRFFVTGYPRDGGSWEAREALAGFLEIHPAQGGAPNRPLLFGDPTRHLLRQRILELAERVASAFARLAAGPAFTRLTETARWALVGDLAKRLHENGSLGWSRRTWTEEIQDYLESNFFGEQNGEIVYLPARPEDDKPWAPALAAALAGELASSGLLVAHRAGILGFVDFTIQEYLTAVALQIDGNPIALVGYGSQAWWQQVFVFCAGMPRSKHTHLSTADILDPLLDGASVRDLLLAQLCARAARMVPAEQRQALETAGRKLLPDDPITIAGHVLSADLSVPALYHGLARAGADQRAAVACVLGQLEHCPELSALLQLSTDGERTTGCREACIRLLPEAEVDRAGVAFFALCALFNLALHDESAEHAYEAALSQAPLTALLRLKKTFDRGFRFDRYRPGERLPDPLPPESDLGRARTLWETLGRVLAARDPGSADRPFRIRPGPPPRRAS